MKRFFSFATAILAVTAICNAQVAGYKINGTATGKDGSTIYLSNLNNRSVIDSAVVANNSFSFSSQQQLSEPEVLRVSLGRTNVNIIIENGTTANVSLDAPTSVSDNGGYNDKLAAMLIKANDKSMEMRQTYGVMVQSGASQQELEDFVSKKQNELLGIYHQTLNENKENIMGGYILAMLAPGYENIDELKTLCAEVKYANKFELIREQIKVLENISKTSEGRMFSDFSGTNIDGTAAKLSDYVGKGKYVLVDFWASWCGPCRREIPNLMELQNKYGGDKFTVLGVNVWDKEPEFKKALASENINYPQLYASHNTDATTIYGIKGIPQIILFAPDGTIVKRDLRGEAMKALVAEKMAE